MSNHRVSPRPTHAEVAERERLELIATDITKSEPERELARERIQALRDAAVARMKLREIKGKDITKSADEPKQEPVALSVKPLRQDGEGDEDFELRLELWQLDLNDSAARKVLDSAESTHSARQSAERTIRKSDKRRKELNPASMQMGNTPASTLFVDRKDDDRPFALREPFENFKKRHPRVLQGREQGTTESQAWQSLCGLMDYLDSLPAPFKSHHPRGSAGYQQDLQAWEDKPQLRAEIDADNARRRQNAIDHSGKKPVDSKPFVASPLQKAAWQAQSEKFARQRGEIVEPKVAPVVAAVEPKRLVACRIGLDGSLVWSDGSPCLEPLPPNTEIVNAPTPPSYVEGSGKVEGLELDFMSMLWVRQS